MELRQLEYLIAVASAGSFTKASADLGVAQSAVSHQVSKLEDELGVRLLHRQRPTIRPTDAGEVFVARVRRVLSELGAAREEVLSLRGRTVGEVTFGATFPAASLDIPEMLARFRELHPAVRVSLREGSKQDLLELLRNDIADIAVVASELGDLPPGIEGVVVDHEDLVLVGRRGHRLEAKDRVELADLEGEAMVGFRRGAGLRAAVDAALAHRDIVPNVMIESNELPVLVGLVRHGHGLAVLPRAFLAGAPPEIWVRELQPSITPSVVLAWRRGRYYAPAAEEFLRFLVAEARR
jgi:DNA-binding transcriptional LysR family regulator